jgi:hemoglobin-like flavoprotein
MNHHTIQIVRESFDLVEPIAPRAAAQFYARLFAIDPSARPLFGGDMTVQCERLMSMLALAVARLDQPEVLIPALQDQGARYAGYGVQDRHYDSFGAALIDTLRQDLGVAFTEEVEDAWLGVYAAVASTMKQAARATA